MIIGVVGTIGSGKSVLSNFLEENGFLRLSFSDEVREECTRRGIFIERKNLQDIGNEMREKHGNDYWARRVMSKIKEGEHYVVEGIRNPGEVKALRELNEFMLIGVDAPLEKRIEWIKNRNKDSDPKSEEGIQAIESRDRGLGEKESGQQVNACFDMADLIIMNRGSLDELGRKVSKFASVLKY